MDNCQAILTIYVGDDVVSQPVQVLKNGQPVDLTGVTEIEMDFYNDPEQVPPNPALYKAKMTGGQIVVSGDPVLGTFVISIPSAATAIFQLQNLADQDVIVTDSTGKMQTYRAVKALNVVARNT